MLNDSRPCFCEGTNPNCCRCDGSGMIPSLSVILHSQAALLPTFRRTARQRAQRQKVENSPEVIKKPQPEQKQNKASGAPKTAANRHILWVESHKPGTLRCPKCKSNLNKENLSKHLRNVHSVDLDKVIIKQKNSAPEFILCKYCGVSISDSNMDNHLKRYHRNQLLTDSRRRTLADGGSKQIYEGKIVKDALDATCGHHIIRDAGRFGSHSSYDSFDDESKP